MKDIRWLIDGYDVWLKSEGVPVVEALSVDLTAVETSLWPRMGVPGVFVHTHSRGDLCSAYVLDIPPGDSTAPVHHLYENLMFVLEGTGSTVIEGPGGEKRSFEWGRASHFAPPLNFPYRMYNSSGSQRARVAVVSNLPMVMKQFRNTEFVFDTPHQFPERWGEARFYRGEGVYIPTREMRNMWESNFIPDTLAFDKLTDSPNRGKGSRNIQFVMGESTMRSHISEVGVGDYKKAHIHEAGAHILQLGDEGYSLYWMEGTREYRRVDWKFGMLHSPADREWHQHFNVSDRGGRYFPMGYGNFRYPFTRSQVANVLHDYSKKDKIQIEYEDEDPFIRQLFEQERAKYRERSRTAVPT